MNAAPDVRGTATWPKALPEFTEEEQRVRDAFMARWFEYLPRAVDLSSASTTATRCGGTAGSRRTLEIGAGLGAHLGYEDLERQEYYAVELRQELADSLGGAFPRSRPSSPIARSAFRSTMGSSTGCSRSTFSSISRTSLRRSTRSRASSRPTADSSQ